MEFNKEELPKHIAIIMDGNRRWARAKGMPVAFGHNSICIFNGKLEESRRRSKKLNANTTKLFRTLCKSC